MERYLTGRTSITALDAGCGAGLFTEYLGSLGCNVSAVDFSSVAVDFVRQRCPSADVQQASLEQRLPFPDATFDLIWSTEVVEHLLDVRSALQGLRRVLKPEGILILTTPYHGLTKNILLAVHGFERHFEVTGNHIRFFTNKSMATNLQFADLRPLKFGGYGRPWPLYKSLYVIARPAQPASR